MVLSLNDLREIYPGHGRILGLDLGTKRIGLSLSDVMGQLASPLTVITRTKLRADIAQIFEHHDTHTCVAWVVGLPLNMDGTEGPRCQATRQFVRDVLKLRDIPIVLMDERLSTAAVERTLLEADLSRNKRAKVVDQAAAAFILQGALDFLRH